MTAAPSRSERQLRAVKTVTDAAADDLPRRVAHLLAEHVAREAHLCVGLSGGVDSVVLLDVLVALAPAHRWRISALHVNHQLSPHAAEWVRFCRRLCRERGVPLRVVKVIVARGDSLEAAARDARYAAYRAQSAPHVVLAQHQDDQAETLLLQLLRGAGVKGLAAMPAARADTQRPGLQVLRPLLGVTRRDIEAYAAHRDLRWIEDESNADTHYLRNFVRQDILPIVETRVPAYRATLARAAGQMAEAARLLDALALQDGADALTVDTLAVPVLAKLAALDEARARNLLRYFLASQGVRMPDARRLSEGLRQALDARMDARVSVSLGTHVLRRHRGMLHVVPQPLPPVAFVRPWREERRVAIPELGGVLEMRRRRGTGIDLEKLLAKPVMLRARLGGERLQPDAARPRRPVKDLFQMQGVPAWQRDALPFLWSGERLVWVAGVGVDCAFQARGSAPGVLPQWVHRGTQGVTAC
jgi:tRNA(Ile)-lysidine synthase